MTIWCFFFARPTPLPIKYFPVYFCIKKIPRDLFALFMRFPRKAMYYKFVSVFVDFCETILVCYYYLPYRVMNFLRKENLFLCSFHLFRFWVNSFVSLKYFRWDSFVGGEIEKNISNVKILSKTGNELIATSVVASSPGLLIIDANFLHLELLIRIISCLRSPRERWDRCRFSLELLPLNTKTRLSLTV